MQNAILKVKLNGQTEIPVHEYHGFKIFASIKNGLPYGYIDIKDRNGSIFAEFDNLQIGTSINLELIDPINTDNIFKYNTFYILQLENDFSLEVTQYAGIIRIWFGHPWFLYKDPKNHAYKPTNSAELIKKILTNKDRGLSFDINNANFDKTDDSGVNRFKIGETDWDFIQNKILPYISIEQLPAHFYCNELNQFYLKSFKTMYKENSKVVFVQKEEALGQDNITKEISAICDKNNIDKKNGAFPISEASIIIGKEEIISELFTNFYFENLNDSSFLNGKKKLGNKLSKRSGESFGNILPIDANYIHSVAGTSVKIIHNRTIIDTLSFLFETSKIADEMISLTIDTPFTGDIITIGQPAELFVSKIMLDKKRSSWMNGKWLVTEVEHYSIEDESSKLRTKSTLIRPSFIGNEKTSTLAKIPLLYES